jgi:hypothetical protein
MVSFEGRCSGTSGAVTHAWTFQGGTPGTSDKALPGPVAFASAGTFEATYQCSDGTGRLSNTIVRTLQVGVVQSQFGIQLQLQPGAEAYRADFQWAADRLAKAVIGPVPGLPDDPLHPTTCGSLVVPTTLGSLVIAGSVEAIDGTRGTLALSSPCAVRTSDGLPVAGVVRIDSADILTLQAQGMLQAVILHEMLHVLGFGTLWPAPSPGRPGFNLLGSNQDGADLYFQGAESRAALRDFNGGSAYAGTPVPVESGLGVASRGSHWRESVFGVELMTPSISVTSSPLSRTTLESMVDLGYQVDPEQAEPFTLPVQIAAPLLQPLPEDAVDLAGDLQPLVIQLRTR